MGSNGRKAFFTCEVALQVEFPIYLKKPESLWWCYHRFVYTFTVTSPRNKLFNFIFSAYILMRDNGEFTDSLALLCIHLIQKLKITGKQYSTTL